MLKATIQADGTIILPKDLRDKFLPKENLIIETSKNAILLKRVKLLSLTEIATIMKPLGKKITPKDVTAEITAFRNQQ